MKDTHRRLRRWLLQVLFSTVLALLGAQAHAQLSVQVTLSVTPPYPTDLASWKANPRKTIITLTNTTNAALQVRLSGTVEKTDGEVKLTTKDNVPVQPILLGPNGTKTVSGNDISLFDPNAVSMSGTSVDAIKRTGRLPDGSYSICIRALDYNTLQPLSAGNPSGCTTIQIKSVEEPKIVAPTCNSNVQQSNPQLVTFQWTQPVGAPAAVKYSFQLIELPANKNAEEAFKAATSFIYQQGNIAMTTLQYNSTNPALFVGKKYAWRVRATDPTNQTSFLNNGYSAACSFTYTAGNGNGGGIADNPKNPKNPKGGEGIVYTPSDADGDGGDGSGADSTATDSTDAACANETDVPAGQLAQGPAGGQMLSIGDTIQVGKFRVGIVSVSNSSAQHLTGTGTAKVPFLRGKMLVYFNNIQVNSNNAVFRPQDTVFGAPGAVLDATTKSIITQLNSVTSFAGLKALNPNALSSITSAAEQNLVSGLSGITETALPVGLDRNFGGTQVVLAVCAMRLTYKTGSMNVVTQVDIPDIASSGGKVAFGYANIPFHPDGYGLVNNGMQKLELLSPLGYNGSSFQIELVPPGPGEPGTFVEFNCKGFQQMNLVFDTRYNRSMVIPQPDNGQMASLRFRVNAVKGGNWTAKADAFSWGAPQLPGFLIQGDSMIFDHSDVYKAPNLYFPKLKGGESYGTDTTALWHGFFAKKVKLVFPNSMKTSSGNPTVEINNLIIDKMGVSTEIFAHDVVQYPAVNMANWGASIDSLGIRLIKTSLDTAYMNGRIHTPMNKPGSNMLYSCILFKNGAQGQAGKFVYELNINPGDTISSPLWGCTFHMDPTTYIKVGNNNAQNETRAELNLDAGMDFPSIIGNGAKAIGVNIKGIQCQGFRIQSYSPYFSPGSWSLASPQKYIGSNAQDDGKDGSASGFPVSFKKPEFVTRTMPVPGQPIPDLNLGLQFDMSVNLCPQLSGGTKFTVWSVYHLASKSSNNDEGNKFEFYDVELDSIGLSSDLGVATLEGFVKFYRNDQTFGNGFFGKVKANFAKIVEVDATAQFGNVSDYRYWFIDARAALSSGIPIFSGVGLYGFNGGVWYNMKPTNLVPDADLKATITPGQQVSMPQNPNIGYSPSGLNFIPSKNDFGFKAGVIVGTHPSPDGFNADVSLIAALQKDAAGALSIQTIGLTGDGYMFCGVTNRPAKPPVYIGAKFTYDFPSATFDGMMQVDANIQSVVEVHGKIWAHFAPNGWFVKVGSPKAAERVSINVLGLSQMNGYIMAGTLADQLPSADFYDAIPNAADRLKLKEAMGENIPKPNFGASGSDQFTSFKFAFGGGQSASTNGKKKFLIFYAQAGAGVGFDIQLAKMNAKCVETNKQIGFDGWYASGQAYAYVTGDIGISLGVGDFSILELTAFAWMQAALPNPSYFAAHYGAHYSLLGGAIEGDFDGDLEFGSRCTIQSETPLADFKVIQELDPKSGGGVDVFSHPQATLNIAMNKTYDVPVIMANGSMNKRTFKIATAQKLINNATNQPVIGTQTTSSDGYQVGIYPFDILKATTSYTFTVVDTVKEKINNVWQDAKRLNGTKIYETQSTTFTTGNAPKNIPESNVAFSYPRNRQRYYMQNDKDATEAPTGKRYVELKQGMTDLVKTKPDKITKFIARFTPMGVPGAQALETTFTYDSSNAAKQRLVIGQMPVLQNGTIYNLQFIRKDSTPLSNVSAQYTMVTKWVKNANYISYRDSKFMKNRIGDAITSYKGEQLIYGYTFRTSKYNTLASKINAMTLNNVIITESGQSSGAIAQTIKTVYQGDEGIEKFEILPTSYDKGNGIKLIPAPITGDTVTTRTAPWYSFAKTKIYDQITWYDQSGFQGYGTTYRQTHDAAVNTTPGESPLSNVEIQNNALMNSSKKLEMVFYDGYTAALDFGKLKATVAGDLAFWTQHKNLCKNYGIGQSGQHIYNDNDNDPTNDSPGSIYCQDWKIINAQKNKLDQIMANNYQKITSGTFWYKLGPFAKSFSLPFVP